MMVSFVLSFFPRDVLDEILNLIGSVSEGFPSYSYFIAVFTLHKMFKSIARYVNAAIKQNRDKVGIAYTSGGFETLLCHWYDKMIITFL